MKNINELRALTDKQLENPNTRRIAHDQLDRLGRIAARHNDAQPSNKGSFKDKLRAERIVSALGARGANVRVDKKDGRTITHQGREHEPDGFGGENEIIMPDHAPIHRNSSLFLPAYDKPLQPTENQRHRYGIRGKNLSRFAKQMRKNGQTGRYPSFGISEENNMNIKEYYKERLLNSINEGRLMNLFRGGKTQEPPVHYAAAREVALKRAELLKGTGGDPRAIGRNAITQVTDNIRTSAERDGSGVFNRAHAADPNKDLGQFDRAYDSTLPARSHITTTMQNNLKAINRPTGPRVPILRPHRVIKKGPTILRPPIGFKPR